MVHQNPHRPRPAKVEKMFATFQAVEDHEGLPRLDINVPFIGAVCGSISIGVKGDFAPISLEKRKLIQKAVEECMGTTLNALLDGQDFAFVTEEQMDEIKRAEGRGSHGS